MKMTTKGEIIQYYMKIYDRSTGLVL